MRPFRFLHVLVASGLLACATPPAQTATTVEQDRAVVQVENQRMSDVNVFVLNGGTKLRLGRVGAKRTAQFTIPSGVVSRAREVEFLAESLSGGSPAVSQRIWMAPGERVRLVLSP